MTAPEQVERCNNTSVGILIVRDDCLLMIERAKRPYGWAPPAGHVYDGEAFTLAAIRETREEVGLRVGSLRKVLAARHDNQCRRPGGDHHHWEVFDANTSGVPRRSQDETKGMAWMNRSWLAALAQRTRLYLAGLVTEADWEHTPSLEPVWLPMLTDLGWLPR